ncbi:hypothetical protein ALC53_03390 [Atta colombica]|uniref:Uncharacterized protein n=1 Tax=Atta colombica TaxID=520822 RepID=A0A195BPC2_9HYME|nr:hypothetical protein ALC53_03390 [Atta colombica]
MDFIALRADRMLQENFKKFATRNRGDMLIRHQCELNKFRRVVSGIITSQFRHKDNTRISTRCDEITLPYHITYQIHNAALNPSCGLGYNSGTGDIQSDIRRRGHPPTQPTDRLRRKRDGCMLVRESLESKCYTESYCPFSHSRCTACRNIFAEVIMAQQRAGAAANSRGIAKVDARRSHRSCSNTNTSTSTSNGCNNVAVYMARLRPAVTSA